MAFQSVLPFNSYYFRKFANEFDIELIFSSPHYPQSNGLAEKAVGIVKNMMKKCLETGSDFTLALLNYRTTPTSNLEYSPAELLMNRTLRTMLPCKLEQLKATLPDNVKESFINIKKKSQKHYNKTCKE